VFRQNTGATLTDWPKHLADQELIVYTGYRIAGKQLFLNQRIVDGKQGIVISSHEGKILMPPTASDTKELLLKKFKRMKTNHEKIIAGYLRFEALLSTKGNRLLDLERFKAYLLFDAQIQVRRHQDPEEGNWVYADGIFIPGTFVPADADKIFTVFRDSLVKALEQRQHILYLPVYHEEQPSRHAIRVVGKTYNTEPDRLDVIFQSHGENVMTIELTFSRTENGNVPEDKLGYLAAYVVEAMRALLGGSLVPPQPYQHKHISWTNSLPSVLIPGSSQFLIASRVHPDSSQGQRRLGMIFMGVEVAFIGAALYFDRQAINNLDDDALTTRNVLLGIAAVNGLASAVTAFFRIRNHNAKVKQADKIRQYTSKE
jgi:hypothetical protein